MIKGVIIKKLEEYSDERGWLTEVFRNDEIDQDLRPVMSFVVSSVPGKVRGLHEHKDQKEMFCFLGDTDFRFYLWDNRKDSETYKEKLVLDFKKGERNLIIVPPGIVHACKNVGDKNGFFIAYTNKLYKGENRQEEVDEINYDENSEFKVD